MYIYRKRARELFETLDKDKSGTVDMDEYIDGKKLQYNSTVLK